MTTLISDSFTGAAATLLSAHSPEVGGAWVYFPCSSSPPSTGRMDLTGTGSAEKINYWGGMGLYYNATEIPAGVNEYDINATLRWVDQEQYTGHGVVFCMDSTAKQFMAVHYEGNKLSIRSYDNGSWLVRATATLAYGDGRAIALRVHVNTASNSVTAFIGPDQIVSHGGIYSTGKKVGIYDTGSGGYSFFDDYAVSYSAETTYDFPVSGGAVAGGAASLSYTGYVLQGSGGAVAGGSSIIIGGGYQIPEARLGPWKGNVGVKNGIPNRTGVYVTLSPSGGDDFTQIQTALNNCPEGQVVELTAGTFKLGSLLRVTKGITLRGKGYNNTIIKGQSGFTGGNQMLLVEPSIWFFDWVDYSGQGRQPAAVNLVAPTKKGQTIIDTATEHKLAKGDVVRIDQVVGLTDNPPVTPVGSGSGSQTLDYGRGTDISTHRCAAQYVMVDEVLSPTRIRLEIPLYWDFNTSRSPQLIKVRDQVSGFGLEDLTLDNDLSARQSITQWDNVNNSWMKGVALIGSYTSLVRLWNCYRISIVNCPAHDPIPVANGGSNGPSFASSRGYGVWLWSGSACLIEGNEFYRLAVAFITGGGSSGNVFGYNYIHDLHHEAVNAAGPAVSFHAPHPMMNLIEGNYASSGVFFDNYWGSCSHNTVFRNRLVTESGFNNQEWAIYLQTNSGYTTIVGNVMGTVGVEQKYEYTPGQFWDTPAIYCNVTQQATAGTLLRHANWCSITTGELPAGTIYLPGESTVLPPSLYLDNQPAWQDCHWPPIGPDVEPMYPSFQSGQTPYVTGAVQLKSYLVVGTGGAVASGRADYPDTFPEVIVTATGGGVAGGAADVSWISVVPGGKTYLLTAEGGAIGGGDSAIALPAWRTVGQVAITQFKANTAKE